VNAAPRKILSRSIPSNFVVTHLKNGDFASFYTDFRNTEIEVIGNFDEENPIPEDLYRNLGKAAMGMATVFTTNTLEIFQKEDKGRLARDEMMLLRDSN
jgi:hypothetical protein